MQDRVEVVKKARSLRLTFEPQYDDTTRKKKSRDPGATEVGSSGRRLMG